MLTHLAVIQASDFAGAFVRPLLSAEQARLAVDKQRRPAGGDRSERRVWHGRPQVSSSAAIGPGLRVGPMVPLTRCLLAHLSTLCADCGDAGWLAIRKY
jgi:hypothetical protein